ncbi:helix-turn-helix domain-containing protein [Halomonas populi]|uniref:helix-turn-helix domain-containing protein n=1 Tax=Vreelandella populi TaxID=2498858 RepID=UPI000F8CD045|nr:helix-turn-helix transcriptional regulator [Halomonas populi]
MNLTKRQTEIVELLASGLTAEQAATSLSRAVPTVRRHIQLAYERVGAKNTAHLVAISIRKGFICLVVVSMLTGTDDGLRRGNKSRIVRRVEQVEMYA